MKILIDCYELIKGHGKSIGIYNYTKNLLDYLTPMLVEEYEVFITCNRENINDFNYKDCNILMIESVPYDSKSKIYWEFFKVNKYVEKNKIDLYYSSRGFAPFLKKCKVCITLHDLIPFYYKENYPKHIKTIENLYVTTRLKQSAYKADKIITISEFSKGEIVNKLNINRSKVTTIYNGIDKNKNYVDIKSEEGYIFAISSNLPHKNLIGILRSYDEYYKNSKHPLKLKICGIKDYEKYKNGISLNAWENIEFLKYLSDEELNGYYKSSFCFLFLSQIEGFGFPPLEAMKFKIPVICSKIPCLEEVVGQSALLVEPNNYVEVSNNIIKLQKDKELQQKLSIDGEAKTNNYDWNICAKSVLDVFKEVLNTDMNLKR